MKIPYDVRWLPTSEPATALLVPGRRAEEVLRVCVELGVETWPSVFATADGFVLLLASPTEVRLPGVVRLRGLAKHLLIPVNAELVPPLLDDEASALVSKRGLVFLPEGRVLEFDPGNPAPASLLLQLEPLQRCDWRALPIAPTLAETITEITLFETEPSAEDIVEQGGDGISEETPTLPESTLPKKILGNALFSLGKGIASMGQALNLLGLAGLGAKMLGAAMNMMPALSLKAMSAQNAALRELLRQFQAGNIEEALKHALPLGDEASRGASIAQGMQLPTHDLLYSLQKLLGSTGGGTASYWFSADDTYHELMREYRKQAELATRAGDFRRAAFIYAKLLNDFFSAAKVLAQGGLHRDAAIIYEKKLFDLHQAAREWEAAGEFDRAIDLYHQLGDHVLAGDLLRRLGEEERAVAEYQVAAAKMVETGSRCYDAGELLRNKAQRPDLATEYYTQGWQRRPSNDSLSCVMRLVQKHAEDAQPEPFVDRLTEAEAFLADGDAESSSTFFTEIARLAKKKGLAPIADDLHDRALLGIARKLRQSHATATHPANLFKNAAVWPTPMIGDAQFALARTPRAMGMAKPEYTRVKVGDSKVTAVCQMSITGELLLGFENGDVALFQPRTNEAQILTRENGPILSVAFATVHHFIVTLSQSSPSEVTLRVSTCLGGFRVVEQAILPLHCVPRLATTAINCNADFVVLTSDADICVYKVPELRCLARELCEMDQTEVAIFGTLDGTFATIWMLLRDMDDLLLWKPDSPEPTRRIDNRSTRTVMPFAAEGGIALQPLPWVVQVNDQHAVIVRLDAKGSVSRIAFDLEHAILTDLPREGGHGYRAFACVRGGLTAGVHADGVEWWTSSGSAIKHTKLSLRNPVAAFPLANSRELLIVEEDGTLIRVPVVE